MHAGDAIWVLHGGLMVLERKTKDPELLGVLAKMQAAVAHLGGHVGVSPPSGDGLQKVITDVLGVVDKPAQRSAPRSEQPVADDNSRHAGIMLTAMMESEQFEWATILESFNEQLCKEKPFFTKKQWSAMFNIAEKNSDWLTDFKAEHPETYAHATAKVA